MPVLFDSLQKTEKTEFLSFFYKHCMHVLSAPLLANTTEEKPSKGNTFLLACRMHADWMCRQPFWIISQLTFCIPIFKDVISADFSLCVFVLSDDFQTCQLLALIVELLTFCVEHHTYHIKNYIINKDILRRVLVLTASQHSFLALCEYMHAHTHTHTHTRPKPHHVKLNIQQEIL